MALFGRKKTTVGLDIGSGLVKVAVVDHSKKQPELVKVAVVPLLADAIVEGEVMDPGIVAEAIQSCLAAAGVKGKQVVTAVGGRDVIIKKIQIERVKEQQARELMRWEAEQHVPFDMESVELDFQILDPDDDGVEMSVLLVAAKRELIESKLRVLTDAGLEPGMVDVDAFALHNAFEVNYPEAMRGIVALVNIGHDVTNINILDDGRADPHARHHGRHAPLP
jgi:type IV pilus assembly protein PilM